MGTLPAESAKREMTTSNSSNKVCWEGVRGVNFHSHIASCTSPNCPTPTVLFNELLDRDVMQF